MAAKPKKEKVLPLEVVQVPEAEAELLAWPDGTYSYVTKHYPPGAALTEEELVNPMFVEKVKLYYEYEYDYDNNDLLS